MCAIAIRTFGLVASLYIRIAAIAITAAKAPRIQTSVLAVALWSVMVGNVNTAALAIWKRWNGVPAAVAADLD